MGDGPTERPDGRPFGVEVDPLVILGGVGERLDAVLTDQDGRPRAEHLTDRPAEFVDSL